MFHHLAGVDTVGADCLVRSLSLEYADGVQPASDPGPLYSLLHRVQQTSYRRDGAG